MKVLYIHQYFCTRAGRSGTRSYEFARYLVRHGHRVTMLTTASDLSDLKLDPAKRVARLEVEGIDVVALRVPYSQQLGILGRVRSFVHFMLLSSWIALRTGGHDVVIATSTPLTVGIPGLLASWRWRIPMVFEVRDLWPEVPVKLGVIRNRLLIFVLRQVEHLIYKCSAHVIALSPGMRDGILATGVSPTKVSVIPNCADLELFRPGRADPDLRARFGIGEHFVAVHAGAMGVVNDVGIVIEAASLLEESGIENIRWLLVGEGSQAAMLRQRSRSRGLRSVVFAGSVSRNDVAEIVRASDVCLMLVKDAPILAHASPNKFFDALAAGRPVVVNTGGWMRELLEQHGAGLASEPGSATALAAHVRWLAEHPLHVTDMGRNARRLAEDCFDRRQLAREFEAVLQRASGAEIAPPGVERPTSQARMGTPASIPERSGSAAELTCVRESVAAP